MYQKIKQHLKKYPSVTNTYRSLYRVKLWLRDVSSAYLSKSTKMRMTPFGFKLIGSNLIHHLAMQDGTFEHLNLKKRACLESSFKTRMCLLMWARTSGSTHALPERWVSM